MIAEAVSEAIGSAYGFGRNGNFLASDMSDFITGQLILCDGGSFFH